MEQSFLMHYADLSPAAVRAFLPLRSGLAVCTALLALSAGVSARADDAVEDARLRYFEQHIRPVLVERCYKCHSTQAAERKQLRGNLYLDTREGMLKGGDSGPAITPGDPSSSLLLESLRYESFEMPPDGKLPEQVIERFEQWIAAGAADPRTGGDAPLARVIDLEAGRRHWAYQPLRVPPASPRLPAGAATPIDAFISARLQSEGLRPLPAADRVTLARRLSFDLLGLPPTPEQVDAFVHDSAPDAYARYVDRLLASPQFGVRWGRHWLDIVRFAESVTLRGLVQHEAWRYRDYVIEAFNRDLRYDEFLRQQVAGDLLPAESLEEARRGCIATTFLTLTDANLEEQDKEQLRMDVVDEQLSVIGEALLGQTIGCARCHDHKFDPIPTADYYAMAGILRNTKTLEHANVSRWIERGLPLPPEEERRLAEAEATLARVKQQLASIKRPAASRAPRIVMIDALPGVVLDDEQATYVGAWKQSTSVRPFINAGYRHDENAGRGEKSACLQTILPEAGRYDVRLGYTTGANRSSVVHVRLRTADGLREATIDQTRPPPIDGLFVSLGEYEFSMDEPAEVVISNRDANGHVVLDAVQFLPAAARTEPKITPSEDSGESQEEQRERTRRVRELEAEIKRLERTVSSRPLYQAVEEQSAIEDMRVNVRGNIHNLGDVVPRGFLQVLASDQAPASALPADESGRRELGDWLASPDNPLPARVYANRVWHWLFGAGLVATPDNFGTTGQPPTHPELLNYLAGRLIELNWSTKALIREIVLSDAYRRRSDHAPDQSVRDPENQLLWRMNLKSIEAECLVDAILSVNGELDDSLGGNTIPDGLSADYTFQHQSRRRAMYWPQFRNSQPEMLLLFDGANPSLVTGKRNASSVAPQALYLMNSPWILDQSRTTARRLLSEPGVSESLRVQLVFRLIVGRAPRDDEERAATDFVVSASSDDERLDRWSQLVQSLFCSLDFRFLH